MAAHPLRAVRPLSPLLAAAMLLTLVAPAAEGRLDEHPPERDPSTPALTTPYQLVEDRDVDDRLPQPEDRYALAGGCYVLEVDGAGFVQRDGGEVVLTDEIAAAEPFHLQALRLGEYLLAASEGPDTSVDGAWWDERSYLTASTPLSELPLPDDGLPEIGRLFPDAPQVTLPTTGDLELASRPSPLGEWRVAASGPDPDRRVPGTEPEGTADDTEEDDQRTGDDAPGRRPGGGPGHGEASGAERRPTTPPGQDGRDRGTPPSEPDEPTEPEWQTYVLTNPASGDALTVTDGRLATGDEDDAAPLRFRRVDDVLGGPDPDTCVRWPEIDLGTSGAPTPPDTDPAGEVRGFFESHVHGMAFEFLGGEVRCGRPWHPYGVEYALGDCFEDGNFHNSVLEVGLAGRGPTEPLTDYDPVGWPTFDYWPGHDTLSHEQYYWRWLERAYHGGLRLTVNLFVDNVALCDLFPITRNSCNEMDGVRLQAQRLFELQDYIDAQSGGPGEGWLRIVTSPTQAREVINAGRLAVVMGIEVSELFDCRTVLDVPQCTQAEIDERLDEVFDMGIRQMQLINKFDNALSGVTGDGGETGVVVNQGNRYVTGHYWDMRKCEAVLGHGPGDHHEHDHGSELPPGDESDRRQLNLQDDTPVGDAPEGIDALAGRILQQFGSFRGAGPPIYPGGPHCNARGLSGLGIAALEGMVERGMILDPDHMSALGIRQALDHIEHELIPAELAAADEEDRAPVIPGVFSSHTWSNEVAYQRIYQLDGVIAPRTSSADGFVHRWLQHRDWADQWAPEGYRFGLGFGADTNGFGAQPGPRSSPAQPLDYTDGWQAPVGDVTVGQHTSGVRSYDITDDGVAHYGLFADWLQELRLAADELAAEQGGGDAIIEDMLLGPETYLQLWERAVFGGNECVTDRSQFQREDLNALVGLDVEGFLTAAGRPVDREGAAYVYCVDDGRGGVAEVTVEFVDGVAATVVDGGTGVRSDPAVAGVDGTTADRDGGVLGQLWDRLRSR